LNSSMIAFTESSLFGSGRPTDCLKWNKSLSLSHNSTRETMASSFLTVSWCWRKSLTIRTGYGLTWDSITAIELEQKGNCYFSRILIHLIFSQDIFVCIQRIEFPFRWPEFITIFTNSFPYLRNCPFQFINENFSNFYDSKYTISIHSPLYSPIDEESPEHSGTLPPNALAAPAQGWAESKQWFNSKFISGEKRTTMWEIIMSQKCHTEKSNR
jgi:hypothetical protein